MGLAVNIYMELATFEFNLYQNELPWRSNTSQTTLWLPWKPKIASYIYPPKLGSLCLTHKIYQPKTLLGGYDILLYVLVYEYI